MGSYDLEEWSERIYTSLPNSGLATSNQILSWLRYNPYKLNAAFKTEYSYDGSGLTPALTSTHSGVYEEMYRCGLLRNQAIKFLGVDGYDLTESEATDQGRQRFVSKNERAKTYLGEAARCELRLESLLDDIDTNDTSNPLAAQILFRDRANMKFGDNPYCPDQGLFSPGNTVFSQFYTYS